MPVSVPEESKVYTTVYENFKGADFTNDPSNVYKRRSPDCKNMIPDLDGRPYKRKGWKIDVPYTEFLTAAGSSASSFTPKRAHHFSLGGQDYMMFFNSLGVFYMSENSNGVVKCQLATKSGELITYSAFPPQIDGRNIEADSGRAFFFEGNGVAGFYVFVETELFRFDGEYFWRVEPYIPKAFIACDSFGVGEQYEAINLLTRKRTIQYLCDGETTQFVVPGGVRNNEAIVEVMQEDGDWHEITTGFSINGGVITFDEPPTEVIDQEDNMRVTYVPDGGYVIPHTQTQTETTELTSTRPATLTKDALWKLTQVRKRLVTVKVDPHHRKVISTTRGEWGELKTVKNEANDALFDLTNCAELGASPVTPSGGSLSRMAYIDALRYKPTEDMFTTQGTVETNRDRFIRPASKYGTSHKTAEAAKSNVDNNGKYSFDSYYKALDDLYARAKDDFEAFICYYESQDIRTTYTLPCTIHYTQSYVYSATTTTKNVVTELEYVAGDGEYMTNDASAFTACERAFVYGSGMYNQVFMSASTFEGYQSRVWYSTASDPTYFPDTNYIEAGGDDTHIVGMMKGSGHVGIIKQGRAMDASVYLAYPTSFETDTTFAVTQSINGVGAIANGAFNILNAEPLFLSAEGVMGIEVSEQEVDRKIRSRSYFINKKLRSEPRLREAISFVHKGLYYLCIDGHCYVLDGSQKNSWANEKTNLQYECYYLENIPALCFSSMDGELYFVDKVGNLCRFKNENDADIYVDDYSDGEPTWTMASAPVDSAYAIQEGMAVGDTIKYGDKWFTITELTETTAIVAEGVAINAVWSTISDDDGAVHFFKNLQKKGCVVSLLPDSTSGVTVYLRADEKDAIRYGDVDVSGHFLPYEYYVKKKIKKYKRLQIICENNKIGEGFGIDQIIKSYTLGNYSKNRG